MSTDMTGHDPRYAELDNHIDGLTAQWLQDLDSAVIASGLPVSAFDLVVYALHALAHEVGRVIGPEELELARQMVEREFETCERMQLDRAFAGIVEGLSLSVEL